MPKIQYIKYKQFKTYTSRYGFLSLLVFLIFLISETLLMALGLAIVSFLFAMYVDRLGKTIPVLELMLLMAALQWILGAYISYKIDYDHWKYLMYVDRAEYMQLVIPGVVFFLVGVLIFYPKYSLADVNLKLIEFVNKNSKLPYYLIGIGFVLPFIIDYLPVAFAFVKFLFSNFKYIGLALLLFKRNDKYKWRIFFFIMILTFADSVSRGMFHDLILWSALMISFVLISWNLSFSGKIFFIFLGFLSAFFIQSVKGDYRSQVSTENSITGRVGLFFELIGNRLENLDNYFNETYFGDSNVRLNQGWIISSIIYNVPGSEPYAEGETITTAISASLLPRFLNPNKKQAGGRENFERFTGLPISEGTSMGTSIIGEAYANFGYQGAWAFMFVWGAFLSWGYGRLVKYGNTHPIIHVFIPLIFLQVIKAETELFVVLNHFVKSTILVLVFLWFARKYLKWPV